MNAPEFKPTEFFARQDAARTRTGRLVLLFALAIVATSGAIYFAAMFAFGAMGAKHGAHAATGLWHADLFLWCLAGTAVVVGGMSAFQSAALAGGGDKVAEMAGGRVVDLATRDPGERRFVNVVEEMSIASGVKMPALYVMDREYAINAFAAGDSRDNAAIAVTRGALEKLERDELQAVIGHEFSHILTGDMRLNIRLIGWIYGLMALTVLGRILFQFAPDTRSRRDNKDGSGNIGAAIMIFGLLLLAIGFISNLFAQMIQAAISRQREHLADASASQFTRNPEALANALRRIAGDSDGTRLRTAHAGEIAHMCFAEGASSPFATHPPLSERIRLLKPDWDGTALPPARFHGAEPAATRGAFTPPPLPAAEGYAGPAGFSGLVSEPTGARAAILLLMMSDNPETNRENATMLKARVDAALFEKLKEAWGVALGIPRAERLRAARLAEPALRRLSGNETASLLANLAAIAQTDGDISGFEQELYAYVESVAGRASRP